MLAKQCRIVTKGDFSYIIRTGSRKKLECCIVYVVSRETEEFFPPRAGFIVSKKVGNSVIRNTVKRRLRNIVADFYQSQDLSLKIFDVVIRAFPASAYCSYGEMRTAIYGFFEEFI